LPASEREAGGRRERIGTAVVSDLEQARRPEARAVARPVLERVAAVERLHVGAAHTGARVRAEVLVVVVARAERQEEAVAERALILHVVGVLIALERPGLVLHFLALQIEAVDDRDAVGRPEAARVLEPAEPALDGERARALREVAARDVDVAVAEGARDLLAAVV